MLKRPYPLENELPTLGTTILLLHEHVEPRTILEHQLAERDTSQVLNSHTVDDKYNDNDSNARPETKSRKYTDRDSQNEKYNPQNPKW